MNVLFATFDHSLQAFGLTLFHSLWQGIVIALLCGLLIKLALNSAQKFVIAYTSLVLLFFAFIVTFFLQYQTPIEHTQPLSSKSVSLTKDITVAPSAGPVPENWRMTITVFYQKFAQKLTAEAPIIGICWLLGFLLYTLRITAGLYQTQQLKRKGLVSEAKWITLLQQLQEKMNVRQKIQLLVSHQAETPITLGWLKPVILLPPSIFTELSAEQLETILVHELAHMKRHDYLLNIIQSVMEIFLFFNPAYWYIAGVLEKEREQACDCITLEATQNPTTYARALTRLAEISHSHQPITMAAIGKRYLQQRIHQIMKITPHHNSRQITFKWYLLIAIMGFGILFSVFALEVRGNKSYETLLSYFSEPLASNDIFIKLDNSNHYYIDGKRTQEADLDKTLSHTIDHRTKAGYTIYQITAKVDVEGSPDREEARQLHDILLSLPLKYILYTRLPDPIYWSGTEISGQVIDAQTGEPLSGIHVTVRHQKAGTVTQPDGRYIIPADLDKDTLRFQFPGYQAVEIPVHFTTANIALQKNNYHPLQSLRDDPNILYIIDNKVVFGGGNINTKLYDIGPANIASIEIPQEDERQRLLDKFAGNLPNKNQYKVVLIWTKRGVGREAKKKAEQNHKLNDLAAQLNKNIKHATQVPYQNIVVIVDGTAVQGSPEEVLSNLEPANIKSVKKTLNPVTVYFKDGEKKNYDGAVIIWTIKNAPSDNPPNTSSFEENLIAFPNPSDQEFTVQFTLEDTAKVKIAVTDKDDNLIALLGDQTYEPGTHTVAWHGVQQPGIYLIKIVKDSQSFIRKVVLE